VDGEVLDVETGMDEAPLIGSAQQLERKQPKAPRTWFETDWLVSGYFFYDRGSSNVRESPYNLKGFLAEVLARFDVEAQHPDDFLVGLFDQAPGVICAAVKRQREGLRNPPRTAEELLATLESQGLTQTVARLRQFLALL
jgi:hypothetical protein